MEFARELGPSSDGHKSLVELNEAETNLWEGIRSYVDRRAKIDMEYADKINKLHHSIKLDINSSDNVGMVEKVCSLPSVAIFNPSRPDGLLSQ